MTPASATRPRRLARALGIFLLTALLALLVLFAHDYWTLPTPRSAPRGVRLLVGLGFLVGPAWLLWTRFRPVRRAAAAPWLLAAASLGLFGAWLARDDDTLAYPTDHPALRSDFPGAAATHQLTLRYAKNFPGSLHDTVPRWSLVLPALGEKPADREKWTAFISANRPAIETRWTDLAALRAWIDELAAQPALADLTDDLSDPILGFGPLRATSQAASAQAALLALDGRRDEAVALLLPLLSAGQKLEVHARTLVRRMIAIITQRNALDGLRFVLDQGPLSDATRARLAAALQPHRDPAEGARLLLLCEYAIGARLVRELGPAAMADGANLRPPALHRLGHFFYNPIATANLLGDFLHPAADAAARRDLAGLDHIADPARNTSATRFVGKNAGGRLLVAMILPAFSKVAESYWKAHDERAALLARL